MKDQVLFIQENENSYAIFLPPDMNSVREFRNELRNSLVNHNYEESDISQIILAADEALTNSITANVSNHSDESIICRWRVTETKFTLYILDYGRGLKLSETHATDPKLKNLSLIDYLEDIKRRQNANTLPFGGIHKKHRNMGKGLKIIHSLMDTVKIHYHNNETITDNPEDSMINGSIVELEFNAHNHNRPKN